MGEIGELRDLGLLGRAVEHGHEEATLGLGPRGRV
jgi:hypothetical protein